MGGHDQRSAEALHLQRSRRLLLEGAPDTVRCVISVFAISQKQSTAVGYASGSWSSISEYANAGMTAAATQANTAQRCETNSRASRYDGKTTAVMVTTPIPFATPYARDVSPIRHAGAIR